METTNPAAVMPNGLHAGLGLEDFILVLGEPHEAVNGSKAWSVGSNDNVIVTVEDGAVKKLMVSLIE